MENRNRKSSIVERIKIKANGWDKKTVQRVSYTMVFVVVLSLVATSYVTADSGTQVSLPGVSTSNDINVNLLQGQKVDQLNTANAVASTVSSNTGSGVASGASNASTDTGAGATSSVSATTAGDVKEANVASSVASMVGLSSSSSVSSNADSVNISAEIAQADATSVSKQQIVDLTIESKSLTQYIVEEGDTAETVAEEYGVSAQTIRWANGLKNNDLTVGTTITVPAVDGVVYTVKEGDTLASIVEHYGSDVDNIVTLNNLDDDETVETGMVLLLPDGDLPETERPEYVAPQTTTTTSSSSSYYSYSGSYTSTYSGNRYAYGYCTWYAYNRRSQLGLAVASNWGNANTWARLAAASGYTVDNTPSVGAIFQTTSGYYGHVGIVEAVNSDGSIYVSEMNYAGWNVVSYRTITNVSSYNYIH